MKWHRIDLCILHLKRMTSEKIAVDTRLLRSSMMMMMMMTMMMMMIDTWLLVVRRAKLLRRPLALSSTGLEANLFPP